MDCEKFSDSVWASSQRQKLDRKMLIKWQDAFRVLSPNALGVLQERIACTTSGSPSGSQTLRWSRRTGEDAVGKPNKAQFSHRHCESNLVCLI